jgi:hypothetical protein
MYGLDIVDSSISQHFMAKLTYTWPKFLHNLKTMRGTVPWSFRYRSYFVYRSMSFDLLHHKSEMLATSET